MDYICDCTTLFFFYKNPLTTVPCVSKKNVFSRLESCLFRSLHVHSAAIDILKSISWRLDLKYNPSPLQIIWETLNYTLSQKIQEKSLKYLVGWLFGFAVLTSPLKIYDVDEKVTSKYRRFALS